MKKLQNVSIIPRAFVFIISQENVAFITSPMYLKTSFPVFPIDLNAATTQPKTFLRSVPMFENDWTMLSTNLFKP